MKNIWVFVHLILMLSIYSCNTTEQTSVEKRTESNGIKAETFTYNNPNVELVQNTSSASIIPNQTFTAVFFQAIPALPTGLKINTSTGEIFGVPVGVMAETEFLIEAKGFTSSEYAKIIISVVVEAPKTLNFHYQTLTFNKDVPASYPAITTGGTITNFTISPTLPAGLTVDPTTGDIGGTPTATSGGMYTLTASNDTGEISKSIFINVADTAPAGLSYSNDVQVLNVGDAFTAMVPTLSTSPAAISYSITPQLPAGLILNTDGSISGTPTETRGVINRTVVAQNSAGSTSLVISITINDPATGLVYPASATVQQGVPMTPIPVTSYDGGTPEVYSCGACPAGITVNSITGLVAGTTTAAIGVYPLAITASHAATASTTPPNGITLNVVENYPEDVNFIGYASDHYFYEDQAVSFTPSAAGGMPTSFSISPNIGVAIPGLAFNPLTGEISGTPTSAIATTTFTVTGQNLDETSTPVFRAAQSFNITVSTLAPTMLGYLPTTSPFYNSSTKVFELQDGNTVPPGIQPNITGGGIPTGYSVSPPLPDGLVLDGITGVISGTPSEIKPVKYYTIQGFNSAGTYSETLAISSNTIIAPISLSYGATTDAISYTIFTNGSEAPAYAGSQGTFSVSPALPEGLILNPHSGVIAGVPLVAYAGPKTFDITITNLKGNLTTAVDISIVNIAPAGLAYVNASASTNMTFTQDDVVGVADILHSSDYDNNYAAGFITGYVQTGLGFGLSLDATTGDITGTTVATDPRELNPGYEAIQITGANALGTSVANFNLKIIEKAPVISYEAKTNIVLVKGSQESIIQVFNPTNEGGDIALTNLGVPGSFCNPTAPVGNVETYDIDTANFAFNGADCSFTFDGNKCFSEDTDGNGQTGDTISFGITAQNSGNTAGVVTPITVRFYDTPDFAYEPDAEFPGSTRLVLNSASASSSSRTLAVPTPNVTNKCHVGDYTLNSLTNLPTPFTFNATDGDIVNPGNNMLLRTEFELESVETNSGLNLTEKADIVVQASHIESITSAFHQLESFTFDINLDGFEDVFIRNVECDDKDGDGASDGTCAATSASTSIYLQSPSSKGLMIGTATAIPFADTLNAVALTPIQYDVAEAGILFVTDANVNISARSATSVQVSDTALSTAGGFVRGIVPHSSGTVTSFGVVIDTGASIVIDQFDITANDMSTIVAAATPTITIANNAGGGIGLGATGAIQVVTYNDTNGDGTMDAVIGYKDATDSNKTKICVLPSDGTNFQTTCSPRLEIPNVGDIKEIKFGDISNDTLDEITVLANDGTNNTVYIFENQNNSFAGLYLAVDLVTLNTNSTFTTFDLADVNFDGGLDIVTNDLKSDIDGDSLADPIVSGLSVYYNTGLASNLFTPVVKTAFDGLLHYSNSSGDTNDLEIINSGGSLLIFHCQVDSDGGALTTSNGSTVTTYRNSSCGLVDEFL
jgi:hypothetical protein